MILDNATYSRLQASSVTPKVMDSLRVSGRSHWAVRVRGQVILAGDRLQAVALYDKAVVLGANPVYSITVACATDPAPFPSTNRRPSCQSNSTL